MSGREKLHSEDDLRIMGKRGTDYGAIATVLFLSTGSLKNDLNAKNSA